MNSPGSAYRIGVFEVHWEIADRTALIVAGPPCICSSSTSSPVTVFGPGKYKISASESRTLFEGSEESYNVLREAYRGLGSGLFGQRLS